ncbi:MAG: helix-turn-helix domain-containing protein [Nevskiaceae bacterium]|jgi:AraC-like DNA-binding protein|nr:helix-turn-helix domain-containing protein [Nevskiaceae bacterium]
MATDIQRRWSTDDVEPQRAFDYWSDTVFRSLLEIDSPVRANFRAQLDVKDFGPAVLYRISHDIQTVRRTRSRIAREGVHGYVLLHMCDGEMGVAQRGQSIRLRPGESTLLDMTTPYVLECVTPARSLMLHFQTDWLRNWIPVPEAVAARIFHTGPGWSGALSASLLSLDSTCDDSMVLPPGAVTEQLATLLALASGPAGQASSPSARFFNRIRRTIQDRCHEPGLDPAAIAQAHRISKRYLHHICASAQTTFGSELMRLRLALAHRLLSDARYDSLAVSEISARCGFLEPSHFAKRFRRAFGQGPSRFRQLRC